MMKFNMIFYMNFYIIIYMLMISLFMMPLKTLNINPLYYMILLIFITFFISLIMNFMFKTWMAFILFLMMIGGLMIIFLYISSINNNQMFYFNLLMNFIKIFKIFLLNFLLYYLFMISFSYFNSQDLLMTLFNLYEENNEIKLSEFYNFNKFMMLFFMLYLLMSMICIMNICYKFNSPIRQMYLYE